MARSRPAWSQRSSGTRLADARLARDPTVRLNAAMTAPADPLLPLLPQAADSFRPWLVWYAAGERVELTGHVLAMWAAKSAGFLEAEAGTAPRVRLALGPSWRLVTWCLGTWLAGGSVVLGDDGAPAEVSVAFTPGDLDPVAEVQVLVPRAPLAVRWEGVGIGHDVSHAVEHEWRQPGCLRRGQPCSSRSPRARRRCWPSWPPGAPAARPCSWRPMLRSPSWPPRRARSGPRE